MDLLQPAQRHEELAIKVLVLERRLLLRRQLEVLEEVAQQLLLGSVRCSMVVDRSSGGRLAMAMALAIVCEVPCVRQRLCLFDDLGSIGACVL